jgi:hypothetical protein
MKHLHRHIKIKEKHHWFGFVHNIFMIAETEGRIPLRPSVSKNNMN